MSTRGLFKANNREDSFLLGDLMKHNLQFMVRCIMFIYCGHSVLDTGLKKKKGFTVFLVMFMFANPQALIEKG